MSEMTECNEAARGNLMDRIRKLVVELWARSECVDDAHVVVALSPFVFSQLECYASYQHLKVYHRFATFQAGGFPVEITLDTTKKDAAKIRAWWNATPGTRVWCWAPRVDREYPGVEQKPEDAT